MGKIKDKGYKFFICFITGLILGAIIGTLWLSALVSFRMDKLYEKIAYLESTIADKNDKLDRLEKSINKSAIVLKDIKVVLDFPGLSNEQIDSIDNIAMEKSVKEKYRTLLGKEVKNLDAEILAQIIDKRILKISTAEYQLTVSKLVLTDVLKLWVKVSIMEVMT